MDHKMRTEKQERSNTGHRRWLFNSAFGFKTIKKEKHNDFAGLDADKLKLWKVEIPGDRDDLLSSLSLQDSVELLAINEIGDYWTSKPPKKHIHVLVEPPETATTSREQKLLEKVASLKEKLSKSTHDFDVVVKPKQKANKWTVNIEQAGLKDLKDYIRELYKPPALENDGAVLNFMSDGDRYLPRNDVSFREMLQSLVSKTKLKFTVFIETPSKPFSDWSFPKVCQLYGISSDPNPDIDANEATKTIYSYCYLASGVSFYKDNFKLIPEKLIEGRNGQGNLDYAIECRSTGRILGIIEVKREDFMKGFAQASVQMESTLSRKRKAEEIDNGQDVDR
ncbi:3767_t:CDS:2, partial [Paraglomus occultum]